MIFDIQAFGWSFGLVFLSFSLGVLVASALAVLNMGGKYIE